MLFGITAFIVLYNKINPSNLKAREAVVSFEETVYSDYTLITDSLYKDKKVSLIGINGELSRYTTCIPKSRIGIKYIEEHYYIDSLEYTLRRDIINGRVEVNINNRDNNTEEPLNIKTLYCGDYLPFFDALCSACKHNKNLDTKSFRIFSCNETAFIAFDNTIVDLKRPNKDES